MKRVIEIEIYNLIVKNNFELLGWKFDYDSSVTDPAKIEKHMRERGTNFKTGVLYKELDIENNQVLDNKKIIKLRDALHYPVSFAQGRRVVPTRYRTIWPPEKRRQSGSFNSFLEETYNPEPVIKEEYIPGFVHRFFNKIGNSKKVNKPRS